MDLDVGESTREERDERNESPLCHGTVWVGGLDLHIASRRVGQNGSWKGKQKHESIVKKLHFY